MSAARGWIVRGFLVLCSALLVGCDHATKVLAQRELGGGRVLSLISGVLDLQYTENRDTAFSLLRDVAIPHKAEVLGAVSALVLLATMVRWWT
ncbi:MAG TPA: signal peptidase II, partial [Polyangiaceae bacterium]|nr:signal peptidase II [Polyangiaceae bacterium]